MQRGESENENASDYTMYYLAVVNDDDHHNHNHRIHRKKKKKEYKKGRGLRNGCRKGS